MLVYLSGPMSGLPEENYPAFHEAAARLRALGFDVLNPAETAGGATHLRRDTYMAVDIGYVQAADALVAMQGWRNSKGAKLEAIVASSMGKPLFSYDPKQGVGSLITLQDWGVTTVEDAVDVNLEALREDAPPEPAPDKGTRIIPMFPPHSTEIS